MKFLLFTFVMLSINNTFGLPCSKEFKTPETEGQTRQGHAKNEDVLEEDVHYEVYGTFRKGIPYSTVSRAVKFVDAKFHRFGF